MTMRKPLHLWVVENNQADFSALRQALLRTGAQMEFTQLTQANEVLERVSAENNRFDGLIVNSALPDMSGLELCVLLFDQGIRQPILLLTEQRKEDIAARAANTGVVRYLVKDAEGGYLQLLPNVLAEVLQNATEQTAPEQTERLWRQHTADLQARNQELDAFAQTVAHDIKSPLAAMAGYVDILGQMEEIKRDPLAREIAATIGRLSWKVMSIVDAFLLLANIRQKEMQPQPLDMTTIVADALGRTVSWLGDQASVFVPEAWPTALGYAPWIEEVWVNYLSNAVKYGGASPEITLGAADLENGRIEFWVEDNGPGLSAEAQTQLFAPFTRLNPEPIAGYGLGLSIVKAIMEQLGGEAGVRSRPGEGSRFYFVLPAVDYPNPNTPT